MATGVKVYTKWRWVYTTQVSNEIRAIRGVIFATFIARHFDAAKRIRPGKRSLEQMAGTMARRLSDENYRAIPKEITSRRGTSIFINGQAASVSFNFPALMFLWG